MPVIAENATEITLQNLWNTSEGQRVLSCMQCGMCAGTCPYGDVMEYPPRRIIGMLKAGELETVLRSQSLLTCVTCYACMTKCPRGIRLTEVLLPLVKEQTFMQLAELPAELQKALENTDRYGNPFGESPRKRADWVKTSKVPVRILPLDRKPTDVLWFVECYTAYHPRGQDNCRATARLFHALGVDFAILGHEEKCAGECARLAGETGLYDKLTDYTLKLFCKYHFKRLVTSGAHAYDTFVHVYRLRGFDREVEHTVTFFARHLDQLKPKLKKKLN
ncbi:MAG: (Fe-S)-binding protein [Verrucomicrobiae bacterium]|nr:(Fe-S)-binding protein [Verrucomicrobiae bacterium]